MMLNALVLLPSNKFTEQVYCAPIRCSLSAGSTRCSGGGDQSSSNHSNLQFYDSNPITEQNIIIGMSHTHTEPPSQILLLSVLQVMGGGREKGERGEGGRWKGGRHS